MERFFAESYARVVVVDPRRFEGSLSSLVDEKNPTDVACILSDQTVETSGNNVTKTLAS